MSTDGQGLLHGGAMSPPPSYGTTSHQHHHHHHHNHSGPHGGTFVPHAPVVVHPQYPSTIIVVRSKPRCRFLKAFIIAILFWMLIGGLVRHLIILGHRYRHGPRPHWSVGPANQSLDYPIPSDVDLVMCDEPLKDGPGPIVTDFEIDSPSETLLLLSAGAWLHGSVKVVTTSDTDSVRFTVTTSLTRRRWGDNVANTIVCTVKRKDGESGVGIFNPERPGPHYTQVRYDVLLELPESHPSIHRLETSVVNAQQDLDDFQGVLQFENLSLHGSNGGIKVKSVDADRAVVRTSNGAVEGRFNSSDEFIIATSNARVDVAVDLYQVKASQATMAINTSNGPIKADISLHDKRTAKNSESKPNFRVSTHTSNSRLDVNFHKAPVDSILTHRGSTSNSPANVFLHPTFEGHFLLNSHSQWFNPIINQHEVDDPAGRGRHRSVSFRNMHGLVEGDVSWGGSTGGKKGQVDISTSNSRVTLDL